MSRNANLVSSSIMLVALIEWLLYVRGSFAILQISLIVFAKVFFPKQNKSGSVIQNKSDAVIIQNNQTPLQVVSNSNQQNNMMMPQFQDIINSFTCINN
jgi:hypothetical protein